MIILEDKIRKANKVHECFFCLNPISPRMKYTRIVTTSDTEGLQTIKMHLFCELVFSQMDYYPGDEIDDYHFLCFLEEEIPDDNLTTYQKAIKYSLGILEQVFAWLNSDKCFLRTEQKVAELLRYREIETEIKKVSA